MYTHISNVIQQMFASRATNAGTLLKKLKPLQWQHELINYYSSKFIIVCSPQCLKKYLRPICSPSLVVH